MGHTDISTTMNIYTDATKDMETQAFKTLNDELKKGSDTGKDADKRLTPIDPNLTPIDAGTDV